MYAYFIEEVNAAAAPRAPLFSQPTLLPTSRHNRRGKYDEDISSDQKKEKQFCINV